MLEVRILHSNAAVGTQILVTEQQDSILVDAGDGCLRDLVGQRFPFDELKGILFTHEHFDHISGLYSLINFLTLLGRKEPLLVTTPLPCLRIRSLLRPPLMYYSPEFRIQILELSKGEEIQVASFKIKAFEVSHTGIESLGYSLRDDNGHKVVISGDTRICPTLEREVEGADIAVLESTYEDQDQDAAQKNGHMTRSQARALGVRAKHAVFVHSPPEGYFDEISRSCRLR